MKVITIINNPIENHSNFFDFEIDNKSNNQ